MKNLLLFCLVLFVISSASAQLKVKTTCASLYVDLLDGRVNGMKSDIPAPELKEKLPCFTSVDEEGGSSKCGGAINYKDKDIYFYTKRDYVEIGEKFQGKLSIPIMGAPRNSLFKWLGNPKLKDTNWDAFQMSYGTLVLHYNAANKVKLIQFSIRDMETLSLCE